ncbi:class I SAM-dependent methyltransferase [Marinobacter lipolyticus]|uniref:class I SAM-dependent methyltransferase n=1 Tax=Marinobacter lipolyticus TaxID=209639 RepID=UPI003A8E9277
MTSDTLRTPEDELTLKRPGNTDRTLRAWDAADELLLEQAFVHMPENTGMRVLVVDDQFGALTLGLRRFHPVSLADSASLAGALALNGRANGESPAADPQSWLAPPQGPFDVIVMRIPRQLDYLSWLLRWSNDVLASDGILIAGGMIKHLPDRSVEVFNDLVRTEQVCPARKKARVVVCRSGDQGLDGWQEQWKGYSVDDGDCLVSGLPAVFARERLDIGTRLLLPDVRRAAAALAPGARVLDLACGNGVLGLTALRAQPTLNVVFTDVSSQAVISAKHNADRAVSAADARFCHGDGVPEGAGKFDLILLNPPFHEGGVVGDHIALRLFQQAARHLENNGQLLMVGNRHLGYHRSLKRYFPVVTQLQADPRFVVFSARHQSLGAGRS